MTVTTGQRIYLAAVAIMALWVGVFCYFVPALSDWGIAWRLPPLCATLVGSLYLSAAAGLAVCIRSASWAEVRAHVVMVAIWTGGLTIISLFYLGAFHFQRVQDLVWWGAYIVYPLIGIRLLWRGRMRAGVPPSGAAAAAPRWIQRSFRAVGLALIALSVGLLLATGLLQSLWPWRAGGMMLQLYSQPILAYGVAALLVSRQAMSSEGRAVVIGALVFTTLELLASLRFQSLFDGPSLSVAIWFGALGAGTIALLVLSVRATGAAHPASPSTSGYQLQPVGE